jgi:lipoprotein-anchoring transpeptidase ErfK/SrfK
MAQDKHQAPGQTEGSAYLAQAMAAAQAGRYKLAHSLMNRLLRQDPRNERAWIELARLSVSQPTPDPHKARSCLRQALRINPQSREAVRELRRLDAGLSGPDRRDASSTLTNSHLGGQVPPSRDQDLASQYVSWRRRGSYVLIAVAVVFVSALVLAGWMIRDGGLSLAVYEPTSTPTPPATSTATHTPTPSVPQQVAQRIPALQAAWETQDWSAAIDVLNGITTLDGSYPGLDQARCDTYLHWASALEDQCQIQEAYDLYRRAAPFCANPVVVNDKKALALEYLAGKRRYDRKQWSRAAAALRTVYDAAPNYAASCRETSPDTSAPFAAQIPTDTRSLLYASYLASSRTLLNETRLQDARQAAKAALELEPESQEAAQLLKTIHTRMTPTPTPTPVNPLNKKIEVDLTKQRMYVWQGDKLIYDWVCSSGGPGTGTATGHYSVLDKIPEAWASQWSLRMPYWLGIYWVGRIENGIHALPILPSGQTLWAGYLGTPVSYGCIILSTENARTLYHWADVGTPVWIHR